MLAGGADPRVTTRNQLIEAGVPLHSTPYVRRARTLAPSILYANDKLSRTKTQRATALMPPLTRDEVIVLTKQYNEDFKGESLEQRDKYESLSNEQPEPQKVGIDCGASVAYSASRRFSLSSISEPLLEEKVAEVFCANAGEENVGGLARTAEKLRQDFANFAVMHDKGHVYFREFRPAHRPHMKHVWNTIHETCA